MSRAGDEGRPYILASEEEGEPHPAKARLDEIMENLVKVVGEDGKKGDERGVPGGPKK